MKCDDDAKRAHYRKEMTIAELHMADRKALLEMPTTAFEACKYITVKTNGYGRFYLNNNSMNTLYHRSMQTRGY